MSSSSPRPGGHGAAEGAVGVEVLGSEGLLVPEDLLLGQEISHAPRQIDVVAHGGVADEIAPRTNGLPHSAHRVPVVGLAAGEAHLDASEAAVDMAGSFDGQGQAISRGRRPTSS